MIEIVCPYCKKPNSVEKNLSKVDRHGLQDIQCTHCSKSWQGNLGEFEGLAKSAPGVSSGLAELRVQVRAQLNELRKRINGMIESRAAAARQTRLNPQGVEKSDVAAQELGKALANGKPVAFQPSEGSSSRFQKVESVGSGRRVRSGAAFDTNGVEKSDMADAELRKALANGKPVGFTPRGN